MQSHNRWFYWKDYLKKKIEINQQELRALQYDFSDFDNGKEYIVEAGLTTGDVIIAEGAGLLRDGMTVGNMAVTSGKDTQ